MRSDGKIAKTVYTGNGVKSEEWIDPPKKGVAKTEKTAKTESKIEAETKETKKE